MGSRWLSLVYIHAGVCVDVYELCDTYSLHAHNRTDYVWVDDLE